MKDEWQPISTAPKDGTEILLFSNYGRIVGYYYEEQQEFVSNLNECIYVRPTYWQPLPLPPKDSNEHN